MWQNGDSDIKPAGELESFQLRIFPPTELAINIICRNCADKNETIVNKVNLVTNSLKTGREAIAAQKESGTSTKRLSSDASGSSSKRSLLLQDTPKINLEGTRIYASHKRYLHTSRFI